MTAVEKLQAKASLEVSIEAEIDDVVRECGGDTRAALRALVQIVFQQEARLQSAQALVSRGFRYGRV